MPEAVPAGAPAYPELPREEHEGRLRRLQAALVAQGLDGVILNNAANVAYWSGFRTSIVAPSLVWVALVVPAAGKPHAIVSQPMSRLFAEGSWIADLHPFGGSRYWGFPEDPVRLVADLAQRACGKGARLGMERSLAMRLDMTRDEIARLEAALAGFAVEDAAALLWRLRMVKTPWEQAVYRELGRITAAGFAAGAEAARPGVSEREIQRAMWRSFAAEGADDSPVGGQLMVRSGRERNLTFCGRATDRRLAAGDQLMLAGGPSLHGYHIDIHRFFCIGPAPDLQYALYEQSEAGLAAALAATRAGVPAKEIFARAQEAMLRKAATDIVPWRVFGHGLGLDNYEPPMIGADAGDLIEEGMALTLEVPAYDIPAGRVMGAFQEESVLVTARGCEILAAGIPRALRTVQP